MLKEEGRRKKEFVGLIMCGFEKAARDWNKHYHEDVLTF
jgi:hypothetical protein